MSMLVTLIPCNMKLFPFWSLSPQLYVTKRSFVYYQGSTVTPVTGPGRSRNLTFSKIPVLANTRDYGEWGVSRPFLFPFHHNNPKEKDKKG